MTSPDPLELIEFEDERGISPFQRWFVKLDSKVQARITLALAKARSGNLSVKSVGQGVSELRLDFGPGYRIYLAREGARLVILLGGGTKKRQQLDIELAQERLQAYKLARLKRKES